MSSMESRTLGGRAQKISADSVCTALWRGAAGRQAGVVRASSSLQGPAPPVDDARARKVYLPTTSQPAV